MFTSASRCCVPSSWYLTKTALIRITGEASITYDVSSRTKRVLSTSWRFVLVIYSTICDAQRRHLLWKIFELCEDLHTLANLRGFQIFSMSCSFWKYLTKWYIGAPWGLCSYPREILIYFVTFSFTGRAPVNLKSFISKVLLRIKRKFKLN